MAWHALLGPELVTNTSEMRKGRPTTAVVAVSSSRVLGTSWAPPRQPRTNGRDDEGCGATDGGAAFGRNTGTLGLARSAWEEKRCLGLLRPLSAECSVGSR